MPEFIRASVVPTSRDNVNDHKIDTFIQKMNAEIVESGYAGDRFSINTGLVGVPTLTVAELEHCKKEAESVGWRLEAFEDNYHTTTYVIRRI